MWAFICKKVCIFVVQRECAAKFLQQCSDKNLGVMKRLHLTTAIIASLLLASCSTLFSTSTVLPNDLYRTDNRVEVANQLRAEAEAAKAEAEAREARYQAMLAEAEAKRAEAEYYASKSEPTYSSIVADSYESAYARRLYGFNSPTYRLPSSYYSLSTSREMQYATAYDPAFYNIMVSGDQVWVEPKYITSMFGAWGATNVTFGIYASPWHYGWGFTSYPCYYSWWGYPHYSWYDWNWNICYNPWYYDWYWGYPGYIHHHHHHYPGYGPGRPPQHRPGNRPGERPHNRPNHGYASAGSGASAGAIIGNLNGGRGTVGSRYTSPTTERNHGQVTINESRPVVGGTVSIGANTGSSYRNNGIKAEGNISRGSGSAGSSKGSVSSGSSSARGSSNFRQGGSSSRSSGSVSQGSSSQRGSSSYRSGSSSGSSSYRGGSTSSSRGSFSGSSSGGGSSRGGSTSSRR